MGPPLGPPPLLARVLALGEEVACITISISAGVCCAGGLDRLPLAGELAVWKGKDGG